jgi:hypothetical protein
MDSIGTQTENTQTTTWQPLSGWWRALGDHQVDVGMQSPTQGPLGQNRMP